MRTTAWTLATFLTAGSALFAQLPPSGGAPPATPGRPVAPPPAAPLDPANNRLDAHLLKWEQSMTAIKALTVQCKRIEKDASTGKTEEFQGEARYLKPNLASLSMKSTDPTNKDGWEHYLFTGTFLYDYRPRTKTVKIYEMKPQVGQVSDDNFLSLVFGVKAADAKQRYDLKLVKEDEHYIYLEVLPKYPQDKQEFSKAQMVLFTRSFMPRRLWFEHNNGNQVTWDLDRIDPNATLGQIDFKFPGVPKDWKAENVKQEDRGGPPPQPGPRGQPMGGQPRQ